MLFCCNAHFRSNYFCVLENNNFSFRKIEFGVCPVCGAFKFRDYKQINGQELIKDLSGVKAQTQLNKWRKYFTKTKEGTKTKQNIYYGDFRKTRKKDEFGHKIYLQLRKNFNNQAEIIGEVKTKIYM